MAGCLLARASLVQWLTRLLDLLQGVQGNLERILVHVFIRNLLGQYLACDEGENWSFTDDRKKAHVFDYQKDEVAEELRIVQRDHGRTWVAEPLDPNLRRETCDVCGCSMRSLEAYFDGTRFLCPECRSRICQ